MKKSLPFILIVLLVVLLSACSQREDIIQITVSFQTGGGTRIAEKTDGVVSDFPVSTREGFLIENWYSDEGRTQRVVFPFRASESCTLYAKWINIEEGNKETVYEVNEAHTAYTAVKCNTFAYSICIPDKYSGLPVTGVSDWFLEKKNHVNNIYIGKNVKEVGEAFNRCSVLKTFTVDPNNDSFTQIDGALYSKNGTVLFVYPSASFQTKFTLNARAAENAFYLCANLKELVLEKNARLSGNNLSAFTSLEKFTVNKENGNYLSDNGILYSSDAKTLLRYPVAYKDKKCMIGDKAEIVAENAFENSNVTEITLGKGLVRFDDCSPMPALENYYVSEDNPSFRAEDGILYSKTGKTLVKFPAGRTGEFGIPEGTEIIGEFAFSEAKGLTKLIVPSSVVSVRNCAFYKCERLSQIKFKEGSLLTSLSDNAFSGCGKLSEIEFTGRIAPMLGENAFSTYVKVIVPNNAEELYRDALREANVKIVPDGFPLDEYTATFVVNGEIYFEYHGVYVQMVTPPESEGFVFEGWYDNVHFTGEKLQFPYVVNDHITFYAFFEENLYNNTPQ